jgi:hypothetical protein
VKDDLPVDNAPSLRFLPLFGLHGNFAVSFDALQCPQDYALFEEIRTLPKTPVPFNTSGFSAKKADGERGFGRLTTDQDGARYFMVSEENLLVCLRKRHPGHPVTAYLLARLELDTMPRFIVLDWH